MKSMIEFLRRFKLTYVIYNFFHRKELKQNESLYKVIGLKKKYFSSISSKDFATVNANSLSTEATINLQNCSFFKNTNAKNRASLLDFQKNGFAILEQYVSHEQIDEINNDIETGLSNGNLKFVNNNKIMFAFHQYKSLQAVGNDKNLNELLHALLQGEAVLFQSINFMMGSEQDTHSDSIHMTTFPLGGLLGVWLALEDINEDNGPLHYYPGSHLLPYYLNGDYNNEGNAWMLGSQKYDAYEAFIAGRIKDTGLEKKNFVAKKGDMLIWHANLFHGGNAHLNKTKTRKSVVFHYFKKGVICYHEITQRPALIKDV